MPLGEETNFSSVATKCCLLVLDGGRGKANPSGRQGGREWGVLDKRAGLCMDFEQSCVLSGLAKEKCLTSIKRHK